MRVIHTYTHKKKAKVCSYIVMEKWSRSSFENPKWRFSKLLRDQFSQTDSHSLPDHFSWLDIEYQVWWNCFQHHLKNQARLVLKEKQCLIRSFTVSLSDRKIPDIYFGQNEKSHNDQKESPENQEGQTSWIHCKKGWQMMRLGGEAGLWIKQLQVLSHKQAVISPHWWSVSVDGLQVGCAGYTGL